MADDVERSPSRLCSRDGKICFYGDPLSTIFLLLCLASHFSFFAVFFLFFSCIPVCLSYWCPYVCAAAICYSQQVRTSLIVRVLSACSVICTPPLLRFFCFFFRLVYFFRSSYFSGVAFFCCALVPGTLALD